MDTQTPSLSELRDIHLPAPPPSPDLWPVVLLGLALGVLVLVALWRWRRMEGWKAEAMRSLGRIERLAPATRLEETAVLVRRLALHLGRDAHPGQLTGKPYLEALDRLFATGFFTSGAGAVLGDALYAGNTVDTGQLDDLIAGLRREIRRFRRRR